MHTFKSTVNGSAVTWDLHFKYSTLRRLKATGMANLLEPEKPIGDDGTPTLMLLRADLERFVDVVWELISDQANAADITPEQFGESLDDGAFSECRQAFFAEWLDFFRKAGLPERESLLAKQVAILNETADRIRQMQTADLMGPIDAALKSLSTSSD